MLVLSRCKGESVVVDGGRIIVTIIKIDWERKSVRIGFESDKQIPIYRAEVWEEMKEQKEMILPLTEAEEE